MNQESFLPQTLEGITAIFANVATVVTALGLVSIAVVLQLNLRLLVHFQRRQTRLRELSAVSSELSIPVDDVTRDLLNKTLYYADNHRFAKGYQPDEKRPTEYREYVSRLLALFDLVALDNPSTLDQKTEQKMVEILSRHSAELGSFAPFRWFRLMPVSKRIADVAERALRQ